MRRDQNDPFEYEVVLSFAEEDRAVAEEFASLLRAKGIQVMYDESQNAELGGGDFVTHIAELYRTKAYYCVMFISRHYPLQTWAEAERTAAQEHSLRDADEYILPIRLDDTEVPGIMEGLVNLIEQKLSAAKGRSGPPSQSHDLRSGHIPSSHPAADDNK
jgi:hypothetical protein